MIEADINSELCPTDKRYVVTRLPRDVRELVTSYAGRLFVGGGFVRATIAGNETPSDIDLFGTTDAVIESAVEALLLARPDAKIHRTKNAITVITPNRMAVQFITRWKFDRAPALVASFDFTVCQAAVWRSGTLSNSEWRSCIGSSFYRDLAGRRLVYTSPVREEEAGGSMLRVVKYLKRGYSIQVTSLGAVMARCTAGIGGNEYMRGLAIAGRLREVDPLLVVDGLDVIDEHDPEQESTGATQ